MLRDEFKRLSGRKGLSSLHENSRYRRAAETLNGELFHGSNGTYVRIITDFDHNYIYNRAGISEWPYLFKAKHSYFGNSDLSGTLELNNLLFFDIETTGLGGSGTVPFLIGLGSITENGFQVRQYFLPDYPDEAAMLEAVRLEIKSDSTVVSYNGKAFDLPILKDRFIIHRVERHLELAGHIDLLYSVRKLYRRRLSNCTLSNIEKTILGHHRHDDIPGFLVPAVYFNWLSTEETIDLARVVRHNLDDIVSLFFILHHLTEVMEEPAKKITEPDDIYSFARLLQSRGENKEVWTLLEDFGHILRQQARYDILWLHSLAYKRGELLVKAVPLWEEIARTDSTESFWARIELAKYYEHRQKDYNTALKHAQSACENCPRHTFSPELDKRINRLRRKLAH
ncbi:MAG: ribonuclease H-like domain-containing protein [candidate division Zixibacteria bacterium]|nr:ribonuclease H-like domain-containing protein [candidate division Zixibacteria bacterium]